MEKIRFSVLLISGFYFPSQMGGPCNSFYWLAKSLGKNGVDVTVMAMSTGIADGSIIFDKWIETGYGRVIYIKTNHSNYSVKYISSCIKQVKNAELVHLNSMFSLASYLVGLTAILYNKPIVWSPRGEFAPKALVYNSWLKKKMLWIISRFKKKILFHTTSDVESADTRSLFDENIRILQLPNFMELPLGLPIQKKNYFLCMGRIHPIKALENIIEACSISSHFKKSPFKLLIVGNNNNEYGKTLIKMVAEKTLSDKIIFVPHISDIEKKNKLYAEAVFSFLPSHSENFGNVVVESLGNGTPVVSSLGTPWKILEEKKAGFWISNKPADLARIMDKIITMPEIELQGYYANARELASAEFDMETNIHKWVLGYQQILNNHG